MKPGDYLRTPQGWARITRVDPLKGPVYVYEAPADDRGIVGAGKCSMQEFLHGAVLRAMKGRK